MKTLPVLLALSAAANVAFLVALASNRPAPAPAADTGKPVVRAESQRPLFPKWQPNDASDFGELDRRLKAAGFSPEEIQVVIWNRMSEKSMAGQLERAKTPYWRNPYTDYTDPKIRAEMMARMVEEAEFSRKYLRNLDAFDTNPAEVESARVRYGNLSIEKMRGLRAIEADYQLLSLKQSAAREGRPTEGQAEAWREAEELLEREKTADIVKLLTPEEYADYELRSGRTAQSLRYQLETFKPSEEEYKAVFAIRKVFDEKLLDKTLAPDARKALLEQMNAQTVAALGPDRAADYAESQRGVDKTARLISRLDLPPRTNAVVRNLQQELTERAAALRADATLSAADRATQLTALADTARTQLTATLGERGFEAYNDMKGDWIRALKPKTP